MWILRHVLFLLCECRICFLENIRMIFSIPLIFVEQELFVYYRLAPVFKL